MNIIVVRGPTGGVSVVTSKLYIPSTYYKHSNESFTFAVFEYIRPSGQYHIFIVYTNYNVQNILHFIV